MSSFHCNEQDFNEKKYSMFHPAIVNTIEYFKQKCNLLHTAMSSIIDNDYEIA